MNNQLKNISEIIGKTIEKVVEPKEKYDDLWIKFTDGSFICIEAQDITEGFGYAIHTVGVNCIDYTANINLVKLGIISEKERKEIVIQEEKEYEIENAEYERKRKEDIYNYEKEQYEKLKNKFEQDGRK